MAIAIATGRGFADAYFVGSGPTAHPPAYRFDTARAVRVALIWVIDALGLITLVTAVVQRRPGWGAVAVVVLFIAAAYSPFLYQWRYHYAVYNLLVFAAASGVWAILLRLIPHKPEPAVVA
ncbi:MAG: hypothetical protein JWN21_2631 [Sphingomonas bacterium]|uniref:hypothetical protein n=1 Tax=Sphingomonas bacterium TaxID=1895847 RepID=UPI002634B2D3|nr:hypothetical protein [Sphingomonas bacterium]MDB5697088.1 hypothetical protein [Sphingomonas bacterium]